MVMPRAEAAAESARIGSIRKACAGQHAEIESQAIAEGWDATPMARRSATASHFAAVLEMAKRGQIELRQGETFAPIQIRRKDEP